MMQEHSHDRRRHRTWFVPSLVLLAATAALGIVHPGMEDPVPVHWNGAGEADQFAAKSVLAVFSPLIIGPGVIWVPMLALMAHTTLVCVRAVPVVAASPGPKR